MTEKTLYQTLNPLNELIDEVLGDDSGIYVSYSSDGNVEAMTLETEALYVSEVNTLFDEHDRPIDPEVFLAKQMVDLISKLERVKTALLKKYPPQGPVGAHPCEVDDFGQEDVAAADAAASRVAGSILQVAGLVGRGLPS